MKKVQDAMAAYCEAGFPNQALNEIYPGLQSGIDVQDFSKRECNALQMRSLRLAKEQGMDITLLLNPNLTHHQMVLLIDGISKGADIRGLHHPAISCEKTRRKFSCSL